MSDVDHEVKGKGEKKASAADLYINIKTVMDAAPNQSPISRLPEFSKQIRWVMSDDGIRVPIEIDPQKQCRYVSEDYVIDEILSYCTYKMPSCGATHATATAAYKFIRGVADPFTADIHPIAQKSRDVYTWRKLPFDIKPGEMPTFEEMLGRMDAPVSVLAWIGSLFVKESDQHQYLWIHGDGQDGKGRLANFLRSLLGPAYRSEQVPDVSGRRFWTSGLLGKRLICFPDCTEFSFPSTGFFKSLSGGDSQRIEPKGKQAYDAEIECKFLFLSNDSPEISGNKAEMRRALYVAMKPVKGDVVPAPVYDQLLWEEAPHFISKCIEVYKRCCPHHGPIPLSTAAQEKLADLVSVTDEVWSAMLSRHGLRVADLSGYAEDTKAADLPYTDPDRVQGLLKEERLNSTDKNRFLKWLRLQGVDRKRVRIGSYGREWRYLGLIEAAVDY